MNNKSDLTLKAIIVGVILSLVMAAANMYLGLKVGMTISANIPCSVMALLIFRKLLRSGSIAEINVSQATGSVGEGLAAGVIFVFPALALSGVFGDYSEWGMKEYLIVTVSIISGSVLGVVLTGFLRKPMVVESRELRFPEGVATAEILKTGNAALGEGKKEGIIGVIVAFFGGMAVKLLSSGVALMKETVSTAFSMGHSAFKLGADTSAALIGVGFIIEFNGAALVAMGGALAWLVFIPVVSAFQPELATGEAGEIAEQIWHDQVRFIGVGGMIVGGIWSIFTIRRQLLDGIKSVFSGISSTRKDEIPATLIDRDLSRNAVWSLIFLGIILFTGVYFFSLSFTGAIVATVYTLLAVFFFVAISVYIVGLIGSTNQPVSGITICTFLLAGLFLFAARVDGIEAVKTILLISGVVCLAACLSGTAAQNFKTAIAVGGSARALQTGLIIAVVLTSLIAVPLMSFLNSAFVIGSTYLPAPQAGMFSSMSRGLFLEGSTIPWNMVETGMCLGVVLIILGAVLKKAGSSFGISPMAVAVGIYLPFTTTLPILFGGLVHLFVTLKCREEIRLQNAIQKGTVICAGLVAGEAITGTIIAVLIAADIPLPIPLIASDPVKSILSLLALILIPVLVYSSMKKK